MTKNIAVLGLGAMGSRMAHRLVEAGYRVAVYNRTSDRADVLARAGATVAQTPRAAATGCDIVIDMVRDDVACRSVWLDPETGALGAMGGEAVAICSSTITPELTDELAKRAAERGVAFVDAPVAGSRPQADAGELIYLVGGDASVLDRVRDVLLVMGSTVHHVGGAGAGMRMKLAVNAFFGIQVAALAELLGMLRRGGVQSDRAMEVLGALPITSPALAGIGNLMAARKFAPMFPIDLVEKDLTYAIEAAVKAGAELPTTAATRAVFGRAQTNGYGGDNITGVAQLFD